MNNLGPKFLPNGWIVSLETITPAKAAAMLESHNTGNRKMRRAHAKRLALLMKNGEFDTTPQGITIGRSGRILDGQHRLQAIVDSGTSQVMIVFRDVDDDVFTKIDQGAKRSMTDLLGTDRRLQEPINMISRLHYRREATPEETAGVLDAFGPMVSYLLDVCGTHVKVRSANPVRTAVTLRMAQHPDREEELAHQYRAFVNMEFQHLPPSILALIRQADDGKLSLNGSTGRSEALARVWASFDPDKPNRSKIQVKSVDAAIEDMRLVISNTLIRRQAQKEQAA